MQPPRRWTANEDELLLLAVSRCGNGVNWKTVACAVPGRTNKACRKRWLNSLSPHLKKSAWTPSEDRALLDLYDINGPKWSVIAERLHGRTDDACSKRYRQVLDPGIKKDIWTSGEDAELIAVYDRTPRNWRQIGQTLQRGALDCRNRYPPSLFGPRRC
ncbi:Homeodomain-like protein [Mycena olivaceomarginata]|nr:Homeodomain-like protein [Mycena olivaceomarginata]